MGHKITTASAWLGFALLMTPACGDDDTSNENANMREDAGPGSYGGNGSNTRGGGSGGVSARGGAGAGARGGTSAAAGSGTNAGSGAAAGNVAAGGRGSVPRAGRSAAGEATGESGAGGTAGQAAVALDDAEIVSVLSSANDGEIQQNTVALSKALAPSAQTYAQSLIDMHQAAQMRLDALVNSLNITPKDNPVAQQLRQDSARIVIRLQNATDVAFDMAYVQSQIDVHIQVLELIDRTLLPDATNSLLRSELVVVRGQVSAHLTQARALAVALSLDVDAGTVDLDGGI